MPNLAAATALYSETLGAKKSQPPQPEPAHGVTVVFIELAEHQGRTAGAAGRGVADRGLSGKEPRGGIHHVCYEVADILAARDQLKAKGARVLGDGNPKIGAHGKPVLFLHPKDFNGTLVELEQA